MVLRGTIHACANWEEVEAAGTPRHHINACGSGINAITCLNGYGVGYLDSTVLGVVASATVTIQFDVRKRKYELRDNPETLETVNACMQGLRMSEGYAS